MPPSTTGSGTALYEPHCFRLLSANDCFHQGLTGVEGMSNGRKALQLIVRSRRMHNPLSTVMGAHHHATSTNNIRQQDSTSELH